MSELSALKTFYRYNARVRQNYLDAILAMPVEERLKDRGASHPSLQEIYVHVLDGLRWWLQYVPEDRAGSATKLPARELVPSQLRSEVLQVDRLARTDLDLLDEEKLHQEMVCHFTEDGRTTEARFPVADVLWHMVEEELQHRGELNALFWQMDAEPSIATVEDWNAAKSPENRV